MSDTFDYKAPESFTMIPGDTSAAAEKLLIHGYRQMPGWKKLEQVSRLTRSIQSLALSRIRAKYGKQTEREERLRLAALWLPRGTMMKFANWDPEVMGY